MKENERLEIIRTSVLSLVNEAQDHIKSKRGKDFRKNISPITFAYEHRQVVINIHRHAGLTAIAAELFEANEESILLLPTMVQKNYFLNHYSHLAPLASTRIFLFSDLMRENFIPRIHGVLTNVPFIIVDNANTMPPEEKDYILQLFTTYTAFKDAILIQLG